MRWRIVGSLACVGLATACMPAGGMPSVAKAPVCDAQIPDSQCLIAEAASALGEVNKLDDWIIAGAEYAEALNAAGHEGAAISFIRDAWTQTQGITDPTSRARLQSALLKSWLKLDPKGPSIAALDSAIGLSRTLDDGAQKQDILAALIAMQVYASRGEKALSDARALPETDSTAASYKARALREIANNAAAKGDFTLAQSAIAEISKGLAYYGHVARTDVALHAAKAGRTELMNRLLGEAEKGARSDPDGYFAGAALRDAAVVRARYGDPKMAKAMFEEAISLTVKAKSKQEHARAMSRIVTGMADAGLAEPVHALATLQTANAIGAGEDRQVMRDFVSYEVAGSAAFAGLFDFARGLVDQAPETPFGSATTLKSVMQRDLAWGLMRDGQQDSAIETARAITAPRERAQTLARLVILRAHPDMEAPARYL